MTHRPHHRPSVQAAQFFDGLVGGTDPALVSEAADRAANLLVRGARTSDDRQVADRVVHLAENEGLELLADLWSGATADSLAGCLWRLYVLRAWVHAAPHEAAEQFEAGRVGAQVARVVAGVADPPGPDQLRTMIDTTLSGIAVSDFADVLLRAAAFARVVAVGRAQLQLPDARQMLVVSEQLEAAAHRELSDGLV